jgi:general nucleoside transport system permease protein
MGMAEAIIMTIVAASMPLLLAALGELVAERSGVLNLGVEGMMIMGAVRRSSSPYNTGQPVLGLLAARCRRHGDGGLFAILTLVLVANQVATGLALTLLGLGLSGLIGESLRQRAGIKLERIHIPGLTDIPFVGPIVFGQDPLVYVAVALTVGVSWFLFRTRGGLILRAVGDNHVSAHALGYGVLRVRLMAVLFGGACAGLGGAYLSMVLTSQWLDNMTAGRGWIALALVVFSTWLPWRLAIGALLFGAIGILQLHAQAMGSAIPSQFLSSLPYLATIVVLVLISGNRMLMRANTPGDARPLVRTGSLGGERLLDGPALALIDFDFIFGLQGIRQQGVIHMLKEAMAAAAAVSLAFAAGTAMAEPLKVAFMNVGPKTTAAGPRATGTAFRW